MKKIKLILCILALCAFTTSAFSQSKMVKDATKYVKKQEYSEAITAINAAIENTETMLLANTWLIRARIYSQIAGNILVAKNFPNSGEVALESYKKSIELDPSEKNKILISLEIGKLSDLFYEEGSVKFQEGSENDSAELKIKAFNESTKAFENTLDATLLTGVFDTGTVFNIALSAAYAGDFEKATSNYLFLINNKYNNQGVYRGLADIYSRQSKKEDASKVMDLLIEYFPNDSTAYISAASTNLIIGFNEKAEKILNIALTRWQTDPYLYLAAGIAYVNTNQGEKAEAAYKKAIELNPNYIDAIYNLGVYYVNAGITIKIAADNLPFEESEKYAKEQKRAGDFLGKALPYLEHIIELQPDNLDVLITLRDIAINTSDHVKAKIYTEKIEALKNK